MKRILFAIAGALLVLSAFAGASSLNKNVDSAFMYSDQAIDAYYWFVNTGDETAFVSFSAEVGDLNGLFDAPFVVVEPGAAKGTYLQLTAPDCMRGAQTIYVNALACNAEGDDCNEYSTYLTVNVNPAFECGVFVNGSYEPPQYYEPTPAYCCTTPDCASEQCVAESGYCCDYSATVYTGGSQKYSTITYSRFYDPTELDVSFHGDQSCAQAYTGDWVRSEITLVNRGAASTFDLRLIGDKEKLNAVLGSSYLSLSRNGAQDVFVDFQPSRVQGGRYWVTLQVMTGGVVVGERDFCVDVVDRFEARVLLPQSVEFDACSNGLIHGEVQNMGTAADSYAIVAGVDYALVTPSEVYLEPGEKASFEISVDSAALPQGSSLIPVAAVNSRSESPIVGEGAVTILKIPCSQAGEVDVSSSEEDGFFEVVVRVTNDFDVPLENVTVDLLNLPNDWEVIGETGVTIAPNSVMDLRLWVKPSTDEEANPVAVVKSNGEVIATKELPAIRGGAGGLTGLVTYALSQNALLISLLVIASLLIIVMSGRKGDANEGARQEKLEDIKQSVEGDEVLMDE